MGSNCFVPNCWSGYNMEKVTTFMVPKEENMLKLWREVIPSTDRPLSAKDRVCIKHFRDEDVIKEWTDGYNTIALKRYRLKAGACPSIFPDTKQLRKDELYKADSVGTIIAQQVIKTELADNSLESQKPNIHPIVEKDETDYKYREVPEEKNAGIKYEEHMEEAKQEGDVKIEFVNVKHEDIYNNPVEDDESFSEKSDIHGYKPRCDQGEEKIKLEESVEIKQEQEETYDDPVDGNIQIEYVEVKDTLNYQHYVENYKAVCSVCSRAFKHTSSLIFHMKIHTDEKPYLCEICSKKFFRHADLKKHMRMHTGEKPYICKTCNKTFTRISNLKDHMRKHTGEKPYSCEVCSKTYTSSNQFKMHMKIHTNETLYTCGICSQAFLNYIKFRYHMREHNGKNRHNCEICSKAFTQSSQLKNHMRIHTGERPYRCEICKRGFAQRSTLNSHKNTHQKATLPV